MYIITKLEIESMNTSILYSSMVEDDCKSKLLDIIQNTNNLNKLVQKDYILSYRMELGYIYNSKILENIYQVLKIPDDDDYEDDDDIKK